jgi:hypothetical protein
VVLRVVLRQQLAEFPTPFSDQFRVLEQKGNPMIKLCHVYSSLCCCCCCCAIAGVLGWGEKTGEDDSSVGSIVENEN